MVRGTRPGGRFSRAVLWFLLVLPLSCNAFDRYSIPDYVDCSVFPEYSGSPYVLPYAEGQRWQVGALVAVGDRVEQGQVIGRSGNSGASSRPHLHFDVQTCGPNLPPGYNDPPCGQTLPVSFRNTAAHACGLMEELSYPALSFTPDDR